MGHDENGIMFDENESTPCSVCLASFPMELTFPPTPKPVITPPPVEPTESPTFAPTTFQPTPTDKTDEPTDMFAKEGCMCNPDDQESEMTWRCGDTDLYVCPGVERICFGQADGIVRYLLLTQEQCDE